MIPQPINQSEQDDVDRLMVRSRINEAIASLMRVREHFMTHRPTSSRDMSVIAADRSIKALRDHLDIIDAEIAASRLENQPKLPS